LPILIYAKKNRQQSGSIYKKRTASFSWFLCSRFTALNTWKIIIKNSGKNRGGRSIFFSCALFNIQFLAWIISQKYFYQYIR
jgi:hypothetical protein